MDQAFFPFPFLNKLIHNPLDTFTDMREVPLGTRIFPITDIIQCVYLRTYTLMSIHDSRITKGTKRAALSLIFTCQYPR